MILLLIVRRVLFRAAINAQRMDIHMTNEVSDLDCIDFELMSVFAHKNERTYPPEFFCILYLLRHAQQLVVHLVSLFYD